MHSSTKLLLSYIFCFLHFFHKFSFYQFYLFDMGITIIGQIFLPLLCFHNITNGDWLQKIDIKIVVTSNCFSEKIVIKFVSKKRFIVSAANLVQAIEIDVFSHTFGWKKYTKRINQRIVMNFGRPRK